MTAKALIERLKEYNPEAEVYIFTGDINLCELNEVELSAPSIIVIS